MKISFLSPSLRKGGAENQMVKLCVYLAKKGYNVEIITFLPGNDFEKILDESHINYKVKNIKSLIGFTTLIGYISKQKPDVVITFMFAANIVGRFVKLFTGIPLITSVRANSMSPIYKMLYKFTYKLDSYSTFNSHFAYKHFIEDGIALKEKALVINNGIEVDLSYKRCNYEVGSVFQIVSIAHFRKSKDYPTLFKALSILKLKGINFKLTILGNDFGQSWPRKMINELDISDNIDIKGFVQNPIPYLLQADVLVLSSFLEGTPNAILEAMSKKIPVIASDIPGNDHIVKESGGGYLFKLSDSDDLLKKLTDVYSLSGSERKELGEKGFQYIIDNYELSIILDQWDKYIHKSVK